MKYLVEMRGITKKFPGVIALDNINFQLLPGEVHVLLGENGAGKSTLMKILSGVYEPTEGTIIIGEKKYTKLTPKDSKENGIGIIYQELSVINELSIEENIFVGKIPTTKKFGIPIVDYRSMRKQTINLLSRIGLNKNPSTLLKELSISEKQQVEIAKALSSNAKILIMDEPTSSLTIEETNNLFKIIRQLKEEGVGIIYISHKLKEIKEIGDRVTILKDGTYVNTKNIKDTNEEELVTMMVGRELKSKYLNPKHSYHGTEEIIFEVRNLTRQDKKVKNISFKLHRGEILGFAGLIGSGRSELMNAIFRADNIESGDIYLFGKKLKYKNPYEAIKNNIGLITENRRETGFFNNFSIAENISLIPFIKESKAGGILGLLDKNKRKEVCSRTERVFKNKVHFYKSKYN